MTVLSLLEAYRFCPFCGTALSAATALGARPSGVRCAGCGREIYFNSVPTAAAVIVRAGRVLLGLRSRAPHQGDYSLPGGFVEEGEAAHDALVREVREETGLEIVCSELLGLFTGDYLYQGVRRWCLNAAYLVTETRGAAKAASDVAELVWFPLDALPENLPFVDNQAALAEARRRLRPATA